MHSYIYDAVEYENLVQTKRRLAGYDGREQCDIFERELARKTCTPVLKDVLEITSSVGTFDTVYGVLRDRGFSL